MVLNAFVLGNKLPTIYDAVIDLFKSCSNPTSSKMATQVSIYSYALIRQQTMTFGEGFTIQYQAVRDKVMALVTNYYNKVNTEHHCTKPKKKDTVFVPKSMRYLNKAWRKSSMVVMKNRRKISTPIDSRAVYFTLFGTQNSRPKMVL